MKKLAKVLSFLFITLCATSCCGTEDVSGDEPEMEKTELKYKYSDMTANSSRNPSSTPSIGDPNLLILPVYFSDSSDFIPEAKKQDVLNDINTAFFGTKDEIGYDSVSSYYTTLSQGKCNLKGTVSEWIDVENSYLDFCVDENSTMTFCQSLVEKYFTKTNDDRKKYDLDKNGVLDGVVLVYAVPDYNNIIRGSTYTNFWAYTNWIKNPKKNVDSPVLSNFIWASYDFMYSKRAASSRIGNYYGGGDNTACSLDTHVYIHEMGHMFGLADYYDYSRKYSPAGGFSMQDCNIGSHDPYSCMALGWASPYIPSESCSITLNTFQSSRDCIILSNKWNSIDSPFDEYLVVEFYSPDGLNKYDHDHSYEGIRPTGPDECGIRLWHVDARLLYGTMNDANKFTCDPTIKSNDVAHMMSNTYGGGETKAYTSPLGSAYTKYNLLQLIRNEETETYQPVNDFDKFSLFKNGSKFSMSTFSRQFPITGKLNQNTVLGWTFTVEISGDQAKINLTRTL